MTALRRFRETSAMDLVRGVLGGPGTHSFAVCIYQEGDIAAQRAIAALLGDHAGNQFRQFLSTDKRTGRWAGTSATGSVYSPSPLPHQWNDVALARILDLADVLCKESGVVHKIVLAFSTWPSATFLDGLLAELSKLLSPRSEHYMFWYLGAPGRAVPEHISGTP